MVYSGTPIDFEKILELNSRECKRAFYRLMMTGNGRYAYADDWNVLADCIQRIFDTIDEKYRLWEFYAMTNPHRQSFQRAFQIIRRLHLDTLKCRDIFAEYRRLSWGDTITPEHTNILIDVAKCLDDVVEKSPRRGRVYLLDAGDWGMASSLIEDGTIVFVNFGTKAMSPVEVQYFLEKYNVVFAILIDGWRLGDTGAFYKVFYTEPYLGSRVRISRGFRVRRGAFFDSFGVYWCQPPQGTDPYTYDPLPFGYMPATGEYMISAMFKIPTAVRWTWQYGLEGEFTRVHLGGLDIPYGACVHISTSLEPGEGRVIVHGGEVNVPLETIKAFSIAYHDLIVRPCEAKAALEPKFKEQLEIEAERRPSIGADILYSWAYARIGRGAVIEVPLGGFLFHDVYRAFFHVDWYVGAIAHVLLGEPNKCYIGPVPQKLRKIVWMARVRGADNVWSRWAALSRWRIIDLRSKKR